MKKKIVIVVNEFQNIINFRLSLINYLSQKNLDISIICYSKKNIQENYLIEYKIFLFIFYQVIPKEKLNWRISGSLWSI